jgi:uncharacterized protein (DUF433 family)
MDPATDPRRNPEAAAGFFELSLRALFQLLRDGVDLGPEGRIPAYGGGLFSAARDANSPFPDFDELTLGDAAVAQILDLLTHVQTRRGKVTLSYRELDVEQLGALYEGLLERAVDYVDERTGPLWRIRLDGDLVLVTAEQLADLRNRRGEAGAEATEEAPDAEEEEDNGAEAAEAEEDDEADAELASSTGGKKPIRVLPPAPGSPNPIPVGSVILRPGLGRKQSGSYYTNSAFVEYLVREAIDPLAENKPPEEILQLAVCDPAMGSGHFLVGACRRLAEHLLVAYKTRYAEEAARAEARGEERLPHELLLESGIHAELAAVWGNEPAELTVCRRLVAFHCLYGVDKNPLAVELARVSLWLATAASDHPLTFLNHRLVPGDSLLGITVDDLLRPFLPRGGKRKKADEKPLTGDREVLAGYGGVAADELHRRLRQSFRFLREIERLETEQPGDFEDQQQAYLAMRQELEDFIDGHALRIGRAFLDEDNTAAHPEVANQWMKEIQDLHRVTEETRARAEAAICKGRELRALCWELAFPERFFEPDPEGDGVRRRERPGFDAMLGNPPWEKIKPAKKEFFAQNDPAIRDYQGQSLNQRIAVISRQNPDAPARWQNYEAQNKRLAAMLLKGGVYDWQIVEVNGERTGGDPDLFKLFLERFHQLVRPGGRVGVLMPAGLYALEGATGLRQLLFTQSKVEAIYSFENWGKRFFPIHASFKFVTLVFSKQTAASQSFPAAFMLRNEKFMALPRAEREARTVRITSDYIRLTSPGYLSLVEVRDDRERQFVERIYRAVPPLGKKLEGPGAWDVEFRTEFHMTNDAWHFRTRQWLEAYGCEKRGSSYVAQPEEWYRERAEFVPGARYIVPEGNKYRISSEKPPEQERKRGARGREVEVLSGFLLVDRARDENELPVIPGATYVPLYEGRMVHQFDHAAKAYVSGEGRGAKWRDLDFTEKALIPHFYVDGTHITVGARAGFCDVTGQTNERSLLAALIPAGHPAGNKVPTVSTFAECQQVWLSVANSFLVDFLIRQKISTTINFFYLEGLPLLRPHRNSHAFQHLRDLSARLVSITPEIQLAEPALDPRERARLRAGIDAIVAGLYGLAPAEFAYILTTFPLLDRDQPPLPGDAFVRWNKRGEPKLEPRSFVTRDTALLAYFRRVEQAPPDDLAAWYRDVVGVNMIDDETCPYRMGPIRGLEARVEEYQRRGAIAYIPSKAKRWDPNGPYQPPGLPADWAEWVVQEPSICNGRPTLRGTRLELSQVQSLLETKTFAEVLASYPQLHEAHLAVVLTSMNRS